MKYWYVVRSKYRNELLLWQQLCTRGFEVYYPRIARPGIKFPSPRVKPYFPGYMFVHIDLDLAGRSIVQWIPGSNGLVCFGGEPAFITDAILQGIHDRVERMNSIAEDPSRGLKRGQEVEIYAGPFAGYRGIFDSHLSDRERAIVFLTFVRDQQMRVELPVHQIMPTKRCQTRL